MERDSPNGILNSWKEIAAYLCRDVSTVQRWEHSRRLPVHRIQGGKRGAVYALKSELDAWRYQAGGEEENGKAPPDGGRRSGLYRMAAVLAVLGAVAVLGWSLIFRSSSPAPRFLPLASLPGEEIDPAFSPDGGSVAFSYRPEGGSSFDLYAKAVGAGEPLRLTNTPESERFPEWSPDSRQLAFLRASRAGLGVWVMGALGGGERKIATLNFPAAQGETKVAWSRAGGSLVVADREGDGGPTALYSLDLTTASKTRLTHPPPDTFGDASPVCSPAGDWLAFTRQSPSRVLDIWVMALPGGEARRITRDQRNIAGLAWTEEGKHLIFLSDRGGPDPALWKVSAAGGQPELLAVLPAYSRMLAVARQGKRIAYSRFEVRSSIWRYRLDEAGARPERLITSSRIQAHPQYSPDGRLIAFMSDRAGYMEIWVARSDGSNPRQLTELRGEGGSPRWSPDGKRIAFDMRVQGNHGIYVVSADGGPAVHLISDTFENGAPSWSRDGRWIYFISNRSGKHQVWKLPAGGGSPVQVTREGGGVAFESPDGTVLYYSKGREQPGLWKKTLPGGEEVPVLPDYGWAFLGAWQAGSKGIYFLDRGAAAGSRMPVLKLLPEGGGDPRLLATLQEAVFPSSFSGGVTIWHPLSVSPDGKQLLITGLDHRQSNIMVAEGFR